MTATLEPHRAANLAKANDVRQYRACLKRDVRAGKVFVDQLLEEELDPRLLAMEVDELIRSVPRLGPARARKIIVHLLQSSPTVKMGALSLKQKSRLSFHLWQHRSRS